MQSTLLTMFVQNARTSGAPGKMQARPMMATSPRGATVPSASLRRACSSATQRPARGVGPLALVSGQGGIAHCGRSGFEAAEQYFDVAALTIQDLVDADSAAS